MKAGGCNIDGSHLLISHLPSGAIGTTVQATPDLQPFGGGCSCNEIHNGLVISQRLTTPVGRDEREETMLNLVPLAGARREMAHGDAEPGLVSQVLELQFPQSQTVA